MYKKFVETDAKEIVSRDGLGLFLTDFAVTGCKIYLPEQQIFAVADYKY
jgi:hypothetical protein